jgi:hypothetical protein
MSETAFVMPVRSRIPARSVALPTEHGAWGFLFEPLIAALLIAPTIGGAFLAILYLGAFLCRQPMKFVVGDWLNHKTLPRSALAFRWMMYFSVIAVVGFIGSVVTAAPISFVPMVLAAPVALYLIKQDASRKSRETTVELLASGVLATSIASLALAAGFGYQTSIALWLIMLARLVPSVLYVRNRLRLEKKKDYSAITPIASHVAALIVLLAVSSWLTVGMGAFLLVRSITGLSGMRKDLTAKQLGVREVIYGSIYALTVVAGFYLGF